MMLIPVKFSQAVLILVACISLVLSTTPSHHHNFRSCTGNTRFPELAPSLNNLDAAQVVPYNSLVNVTRTIYGNTIITQNPDGSLAGPFNELLYAPTIVQPWIDLQLAVAALLNPFEYEAAILGVLSVTKPVYGIYAHTILAEKAGYTSAQVAAMLAGTSPSGITARAKAIYILAADSVRTRGPLDEASFNAAFSVLGQDGVNAAIQQAAAFMYTTIMLNVGDVCLPSSVK